MCGAFNRLLHWSEIEYYKTAGWAIYDFGGIGDGTELPTLGDMERRLIAAALRKSAGNKKEAARLLGIDRQRLYRKIEKFGL